MADVVTEGEAEAYEYPQYADYAHCNKALEHSRDDVFGADHTAIEEGEARGHHQYEDGCRNHPGDIGRIDFRVEAPESTGTDSRIHQP